VARIGEPVKRYTVIPLEEPVSPTHEPVSPLTPSKLAGESTTSYQPGTATSGIAVAENEHERE
jgi:hypothetical protein